MIYGDHVDPEPQRPFRDTMMGNGKRLQMANIPLHVISLDFDDISHVKLYPFKGHKGSDIENIQFRWNMNILLSLNMTPEFVIDKHSCHYLLSHSCYRK